jgi:hypothetical protein
MSIKRFALYDNWGKTIDRYTLVDIQSADIMNWETHMQCTSFSIDWDTPQWIISHDCVYPEDLHLLGEEALVKFNDEALFKCIDKIRKTYYK